MKSMKTMICIWLLVFISLTPTYASNVENELKEVTGVFEDKVNLFEESIEGFDGLISESYLSFSEISTIVYYKDLYIRNYDDSIYYLRDTFTDKELVEYFSYSKEQVYAIRNFDSSNEMRVMASATLTSSLYISEYFYNASLNRTYLTVRYNITIQGLDYASILTSRKVTIGIRGSSASYHRISQGLTATYRPMFYMEEGFGNLFIARSNPSVIYHSQLGVEMTFPSKIYTSVPPDLGGGSMDYYLYKINSFYRGFADNRVGISDIIAGYAKPRLDISFSLGLSASGPSIALAPSITTHVVDSKIHTCTIESAICY